MSAAVIAYGAMSGLGEGMDAASAGAVGAPARVAIADDEELVAAGFVKPFAARARLARPEDGLQRVASDDGGDDRATRLLVTTLAQCVRGLDARIPGWRSSASGSRSGRPAAGCARPSASSSGWRRGAVRPPERDFAARAAYFGPLLDAVAAEGSSTSLRPRSSCARARRRSSLWGSRRAGFPSASATSSSRVGFDAVSPFVASGFESLHATSARVPPSPFRLSRDGMALGEAAAVFALTRPEDAPPGHVLGYVCGFGASADGVHITAPDRTGAGLARAARAALDDAGRPARRPPERPRDRHPLQRRRRGARHRSGARIARRRRPRLQGAGGAHARRRRRARVARLPRRARPRRPPGDGGGGGHRPGGPGAHSVGRRGRVAPRGAQARLCLRRRERGAGARSRSPGDRRARAAREAWITRAARVSTLPEVASLAEAVGVPGRQARARRRARALGARRDPRWLERSSAVARRSRARGSSWGPRPRPWRRTPGSPRACANAARASSNRGASRIRHRTPSPVSAASPSGSTGHRFRSARDFTPGWRRSRRRATSSEQGTRSGCSSSPRTTSATWRAPGRRGRRASRARRARSRSSSPRGRTSASVARVTAVHTSLAAPDRAAALARSAPRTRMGTWRSRRSTRTPPPARVEASSSLLGTPGRAPRRAGGFDALTRLRLTAES